MSTLKVDGIRSNSASSDAITLANDGTCTANITNRSNRNLIINGAFNVAQRGTSSTSSGFQTVDRFYHTGSGWDEAITVSQFDVSAPSSPYHLPTSGAHPYKEGFRKSFGVTNGNQTSGAGVTDFLTLRTILEAQDIANSGWDYTSASSYVTLSFWIKSSVAQNFYGYLKTEDGTAQRYAFETGSLSAFTWTKITKTIPGHANLTFNNDTGKGLEINVSAFWGTDYTDSGVSLNAWGAHASGTRTPDSTSTWYTTNDASLQITGVQLELGSVGTDFEHRSFSDELNKCQRYYVKHTKVSGAATAYNAHSDGYRWWVPFYPQMRADPTISDTGGGDGGSNATFNIAYSDKTGYTARIESTTTSSSEVWYYDATVSANAEF